MSNQDETFDSDLDEIGYEFKDELKIRKVLEEHTEWDFEFTKNTQYQYDLVIHQWGDKPRTHDDQQVIGYVELERSRRDKEHSWVMGSVPDNWYYLTFLQRKVRDYDHVAESWQGLKDNYDRTVYLKFNHAMTNCFAAPIEVIYQDGTPTKRSDGGYNSSYLKLDKDHPAVEYGISSCVSLIQDYLTRRGAEQTTLLSWGVSR